MHAVWECLRKICPVVYVLNITKWHLTQAHNALPSWHHLNLLTSQYRWPIRYWWWVRRAGYKWSGNQSMAEQEGKDKEKHQETGMKGKHLFNFLLLYIKIPCLLSRTYTMWLWYICWMWMFFLLTHIKKCVGKKYSNITTVTILKYTLNVICEYSLEETSFKGIT